MTPAYPPGTLVIVRPVDPAEIAIGTPITYQLESGKDVVVTHRVVSITSSSDGGRSFVTQGDANGAPDAKPVLPVQVRGAVWYAIPWLGYVNTLVNGPAAAWLVPLVAAALLAYAACLAGGALVAGIRRRRGVARPAPDARPGWG
jgi:signal peptidase